MMRKQLIKQGSYLAIATMSFILVLLNVFANLA